MTKGEYKVNLPKTNFPMKANLVNLEPEMLLYWENNQIYQKSVDLRQKNEKYILHDGPPYLSSNKIHIGTALNKILKDIVTKYKSLQGFYSPYVPGYDSHGLPIENAVLKTIKGGRAALSPAELRQKCEAFALSNLTGQENEFKRLGVWGDFAHPYITLNKEYEAEQLRVFAKMADKGYLYKGLKAVSWCPTCETALAEAEIEYSDHISDAVYVAFNLTQESKQKLNLDNHNSSIALVIWTTTPWTLPSNLAIAVNESFDYEVIKINGDKICIVSSNLKTAFLNDTKLTDAKVEVLKTLSGKDLVGSSYHHPFENRTSPVVPSNHVTSETGTGLVHIAPGHGPEDFELGLKLKLGIISPVDEKGYFTDEVSHFAKLRYDKANEPIIELLNKENHLLGHNKLNHSYPHCWRCKKALIFRATKQWFASVDGFRDAALKAIDSVKWIPESGRNRIYNMVQNRFDWCISRQRAWGVPIPVFYCNQCNEILMTQDSIEEVAKVFEKEGSNSFWLNDANYFLKDKFSCNKCGHKTFSKETDIMDVWFDSGVSHQSVLVKRPELKGSPCELYLEGSDQHRGWFQSSLLTSVAINDYAPYKTVLTHGFVMDEHGRKMSKSQGNVVEPEQVIKQYGADILRLWVASVNYSDDIPIGKNMLAQLAEIYRKIRNTLRYMLGNLDDFNPSCDYVELSKLNKIDAYMLHRLNIFIGDVIKNFDNFEFHKFYQLMQNFCVVELSSFYFDIVKDILYTQKAKSKDRLSTQTVLYEMLMAIVKMLAPVTPFLAEDAWRHLPKQLGTNLPESVLLTDFPTVNKKMLNNNLAYEMEKLITVRTVVNKALEIARGQAKIGSSLEASVFLEVEDKELLDLLKQNNENLANLFITSHTVVKDNGNLLDINEEIAQNYESGIKATVTKANGTKCLRCWKYRQDAQDNLNKSNEQLCNECIASMV